MHGETQALLVRTDDDAELSVRTVGVDNGESVMLIHGFSLDHTTWEPVAAHLVADGFRVVMPDLRGHGCSTLGSANDRSTRGRSPCRCF